MQNHRFLYLTVLLSMFLSPLVARAEFYLHDWEDQHIRQKQWTLDVGVQFATSQQNYDANGNTQTPTDLEKYNRVLTSALARYGFSKRFTGYARLDWGLVDYTQSTGNFNGFGLVDQSAGLNFRAYESQYGTGIDLQVQVDFPGYDNLALQNEGKPLLGDSTTDVSVGALAHFSLSQDREQRTFLQAGAAYRFRSENFSASIPWSIKVASTPFKEGIFWEIGGAGIINAGNNNITTLAGTSGNGGSLFANATSPTLAMGVGEIGYRFDTKMALGLDVRKTLFGSNAPDFLGVGLALHITWDKESPSPYHYNKSNRGFVTYEFVAKVTRANDRLHLVRINKGRHHGVRAGQVFDIFARGEDGQDGDVVARASVESVKNNEAILKVVEYFREAWIEKGFSVKRPIK